MSSAFLRYLAAKRSVDDRSLNRHVVECLRRHQPVGEPGAPVRVIDLGAGTGSMATRVSEWDLLRYAEYTAVDSDAAAVAEARRLIPEWARARGLSCHEGEGGVVAVEGPDRRLELSFVQADALTFSASGAPWDLLIANAFLDLVEVPAVLPRLWKLLRPGGHFWFTVNFDGETVFLPEADPAIEDELIARYHRSMDERIVNGRPSGDSRTGRKLFSHLPASGAQILAAGASDWVVHPVGGRYANGEDVFLHHIVNTIDQELRRHPAVSRDDLRAWTSMRRRQIDAAELVYIAHQLDFFGRAPG